MTDKAKDLRAPAARFTPGPWEAVPPKHRNHAGAVIEILPEGKRSTRSEWVHIASVACAATHADADARLIAAAPDLYGALEEALAEADDCDPMRLRELNGALVGGVVPRPHFAWREKARDAMAKAQGIAPQAPSKDLP